jgi:protein tyrosine phosphatase (PTP) superfamily phosphohydrolase (DUF442 family)/cytochrome c556
MPRLAWVCILALFSSCALAAEPARPVETKTLHNVFRIDDTLFSGDAPDTEAAFRELAQLGVKTIVSVDGSKPAVDLAHRFGMHYVHLPIGYDGVPQVRGEELSRAVQAADGPVYMHCHHGKHRGPAAVGVVCRALKGWSAEKADAFLHEAGTSPDYAGLFRDVRDFRVPSPDELSKRPANFPEAAKTEPLVDPMVAIDEHFDALKAAQKTGWDKASPRPVEVATVLWEDFRELARNPAVEKCDEDFRAKLKAAEESAAALSDLLREPKDAAPIDAAFQRATQSCTDCHKSHRNQRTR